MTRNVLATKTTDPNVFQQEQTLFILYVNTWRVGTDLEAFFSPLFIPSV
jgi:hypothetical protein